MGVAAAVQGSETCGRVQAAVRGKAAGWAHGAKRHVQMSPNPHPPHHHHPNKRKTRGETCVPSSDGEVQSMDKEGSCRGSEGSRALEGGWRMQMCSVVVEGGTMGEAQQAIVWGGQEPTHERHESLPAEHQAGALHWSPDHQWGFKASVPGERMPSGLWMGGRGPATERQRAGGGTRRVNRSRSTAFRRQRSTFESITFEKDETLMILPAPAHSVIFGSVRKLPGFSAGCLATSTGLSPAVFNPVVFT